MTDVMMEGLKFLGKTGQVILKHSMPQDITLLADKIEAIANEGAVNQKLLPATEIAVRQLSNLTYSLILTSKQDVSTAAESLRKNLLEIAVLFIHTVPDTRFSLNQKYYLSPYYSTSNTGSFLSLLTKMVAEISGADADNEIAKTLIRNISAWADGVARSQEALLLLSVEKRTSFAHEIMCWAAHSTKLLQALSNAPACEEHYKIDLRNSASSLISIFSRLPRDEESVAFAENYNLSGIIFEAAMLSHALSCDEAALTLQQILLGWTFKEGTSAHSARRITAGLCGLAVLSIALEELTTTERLYEDIGTHLNGPNSPPQEIRDRIARDIREKADNPHRRRMTFSRIEIELNQAAPEVITPVLVAIADLL
jgi:hypothetical protein